MYLWQNPDERNTIDLSPDYRSNYGRELNFLELARYTKENEYVYVSNWSSVEQRSLDEIKYNVVGLLYHELAHANDYVPPSKLQTLLPELRFYDALVSIQDSQL